MSVWEPYFRPTTRVHDSGFRCFECGYLEIGDDNKAKKKVVVARGVDHIDNYNFLEEPIRVDMDLLKDGNIRLFCCGMRLFWSIPGFSDAHITTRSTGDPFLEYDRLEEIWEKQNRKEAESA